MFLFYEKTTQRTVCQLVLCLKGGIYLMIIIANSDNFGISMILHIFSYLFETLIRGIMIGGLTNNISETFDT